MATRSTLGSQKFKALLTSLSNQAEFICQPCDGLADAIEHHDTIKTKALCADYTSVIGHFGIQAGDVDTLVLGCTHYPFASQYLQERVGPEVRLLGNGAPIARQARQRLTVVATPTGPGLCVLLTTGTPDTLQTGAQRWLGLPNPLVRSLSV
ncbi:glutamate racemase 1 [mine drainage metagenome]|uniref:Glutamate racemase 1 n=1 Tax=mine drainage metagenome TaxID=410659 RepID=A0A1J5PKB4_9ZZZZ